MKSSFEDLVFFPIWTFSSAQIYRKADRQTYVCVCGCKRERKRKRERERERESMRTFLSVCVCLCLLVNVFVICNDFNIHFQVKSHNTLLIKFVRFYSIMKFRVFVRHWNVSVWGINLDWKGNPVGQYPSVNCPAWISYMERRKNVFSTRVMSTSEVKRNLALSIFLVCKSTLCLVC